MPLTLAEPPPLCTGGRYCEPSRLVDTSRGVQDLTSFERVAFRSRRHRSGYLEYERFGTPPSSLRERAATEAAEQVLKALEAARLYPDRRSFTTDGSLLIQFLSEPVSGVDVYPNGDAIVIIRDGDVDHVHELTAGDGERIVGLLKHGRK